MKLFNEEQIRGIYRDGFNDGLSHRASMEDLVIDTYQPIELASDEDEEKAAMSITKNIQQHMGFNMGVKWIKEQILNQSFVYCQRQIEGQIECDKQCEHCKKYYEPLINQKK